MDFVCPQIRPETGLESIYGPIGQSAGILNCHVEIFPSARSAQSLNEPGLSIPAGGIQKTVQVISFGVETAMDVTKSRPVLSSADP